MVKNKVVYKQALRLAVPMMIQNGITNTVGLIDNVMVGSLGTEAMTAVSIVGQLIFVFNLAIFGGISGPGIYGAQYLGQKNIEGFRNTFRIKLWISLIVVLGGLFIFLAIPDTLMGLYLHGESVAVNSTQTLEYGKQYLMIMLVGLLPFAVTQVYASSLREAGESVKPMVAGLVSVGVDILFNYLLIYGKLGMPMFGVKGAAIATVLSRIVECGIVVIWATADKKEHEFLQGVYQKLTVPPEIIKEIMKKGLPIFLNEFLWAGGMATLTQCYSMRSLEVIAGINISNAICGLMNVVFIALGSAVGILIGQTLGASEYEKAQRDSYSLMWFTGFVCLGLSIILIAVSGVFPKLYDTTNEIRKYGQWFIIITAFYFPVQGSLNALYFTLRSGGKTVITFLFDSVYSWVVAVLTAFLLCKYTDIPILGIYAIVQSADIVKLMVGYILIRKGVWISNIVDEK